jgi:hypothetical protein
VLVRKQGHGSLEAAKDHLLLQDWNINLFYRMRVASVINPASVACTKKPPIIGGFESIKDDSLRISDGESSPIQVQGS